jgi:glycosyltransferase involved in cell wall biosynthesis
MKILMTADPIGGVWSYAMELCAALRPYGAEIMLATLGAALSRSQRAQVARLRHVTLRESAYLLEWMDSPWQSLDEAAGWLLGLEGEISPDVIHLNHLAHADLPWRAPVMVVGHSCVLSWWAAVRDEPLPESLARYRERVTRSLRAANLVAAPTHAMLAELNRHYGPLPYAEVIANGRDPRSFSRAHKESLVFCAGRLWDDAKNISLVCAAAPALAWPVYVAGSVVAPSGGERTLAGVRALGSLSPVALAKWYARAAIYVLPARYEPFGLTALEAALSGCALVLGDIASLREVWGESALYVNPDDPAALRETLDELIHDPVRRRMYAALAMARAKRFTPANLAAACRNAYWSLLHTQESRACASSSSITH